MLKNNPTLRPTWRNTFIQPLFRLIRLTYRRQNQRLLRSIRKLGLSIIFYFLNNHVRTFLSEVPTQVLFVLFFGFFLFYFWGLIKLGGWLRVAHGFHCSATGHGTALGPFSTRCWVHFLDCWGHGSWLSSSSCKTHSWVINSYKCIHIPFRSLKANFSAPGDFKLRKRSFCIFQLLINIFHLISFFRVELDHIAS